MLLHLSDLYRIEKVEGVLRNSFDIEIQIVVDNELTEIARTVYVRNYGNLIKSVGHIDQILGADEFVLANLQNPWRYGTKHSTLHIV